MIVTWLLDVFVQVVRLLAAVVVLAFVVLRPVVFAVGFAGGLFLGGRFVRWTERLLAWTRSKRRR